MKFPEDVKIIARNVVAEYLHKSGCIGAAENVRSGKADKNFGVEMACMAIMSERERLLNVVPATEPA